MMIPVLGGPEEGGVMWVDEGEVEARRFDRDAEPPNEPGPGEREVRASRFWTQLAFVVHAVVVAFRLR